MKRRIQLRKWALAALLALIPMVIARGADAPQAPTDKAMAAPTPAQVDFFEKNIRPALHKYCYSCHSVEAEKVKGKLLLDDSAAVMRGGESGPAIVPGEPERSLLIKAIRYDDADLQMPPKGKMPDAVIASFVEWVKMGAPDPRKVAAKRAGDGDDIEPGHARPVDIERGRGFWAFRPITSPTAPQVSDASWPRGDIDRFVLAALEAKQIHPVADADKRTLIRRLYFDLIGLPPTPEAIDAFLKDESSDAVAKVVDELLASPRFGERWGRHWLDIARHADSNGGDINLTYHQAWRYRDYVINAFNSDKPFDQFVIEQIAGDLITPAPGNVPGSSGDNDAQRAERLVATGFLVVGPKMLSERDKDKLRMDVVDEQVDTVGRAFLGLTLGCARCHDHKFDPIPTTDYYGLAGIFRSTQTIAGIKLGNVFVSGWLERELPIDASEHEAIGAYKKSLADLEAKVKQAKAEHKKLQDQLPSDRDKLAGVVVDDAAAKKVGDWKDSTYTPRYIGKGYLHDNKEDKGKKSVIYTPDLPRDGLYEVRIAYTGGKGRARNVPITIQCADGTKTITFDQEPQPTIDTLWAKLGRYRFDKGKAGSVTIGTADTGDLYVVADAIQFIHEDDLKDGAKPVNAKDAEPDPNAELLKQLAAADRATRDIEKKLDDLKKNAPKSAPTAMAVQDWPDDVGDAHVHIRGEVRNLGAVTPRGVLTVATASDPTLTIPNGQSGRLELAQWIASRDNPLTARVIVNRVWQHLFGQGIVRSVDNFGELGDRPANAALLDHLASRFIAEGWSIKRLVRAIVLSRTYQLSDGDDAAASEADIENRLNWRQNRRRLEAEAIRDAILAISGSLDLSPAGSGVSHLGESAIENSAKQSGGVDTEAINRRSVYLPVIRADVDPMMSVFDFADPEMVMGERPVTTTPSQALLMLNSPFVQRHATETAQRLLTLDSLSDAQRVERVYMQMLGRPPAEHELDRALAFIKDLSQTGGEADANKQRLTAWASLCQALFASTEFRFVD